MKLIGNSMILGMMEVMAESFTLAEKAGIGADRTVDIVKGNQIQRHIIISLLDFLRRALSQPDVNMFFLFLWAKSLNKTLSSSAF
jgi:3-hydroxyisobutyrate dehydrogenase-like beta-hydroxyacid dehydrogenase